MKDEARCLLGHFIRYWYKSWYSNCGHSWMLPVHPSSFCYSTTSTFGFPHKIWCQEIELDCIWTILLDIINYTKEWRNILDLLLVYVTMTMRYPELHKTQSNVDGDIIMHKLPKDGAARAAWINAILKDTYFCDDLPAWPLGNGLPVFSKINPSPVR